MWSTIDTTLEQMSTDKIKQLLMQLDIAPERRENYAKLVESANLTGLVLSICDLSAVKETLNV